MSQLLSQTFTVIIRECISIGDMHLNQLFSPYRSLSHLSQRGRSSIHQAMTILRKAFISNPDEDWSDLPEAALQAREPRELRHVA